MSIEPNHCHCAAQTIRYWSNPNRNFLHSTVQYNVAMSTTAGSTATRMGSLAKRPESVIQHAGLRMTCRTTGTRRLLVALVSVPLGLLACGCGNGSTSTPPTGSAVKSLTNAPSIRPSPRPSAKRTGSASRRTAPHSAVRILSVLAAIPVKGRAPLTGYDRDEFGPAWTDDNTDPDGHNGCDTRNDVLRRDLRYPVIEAGTNKCVVLSGQLDDPYTATDIHFLRGETTSSQVQIDHVVALGDAWQTGAQQWGADKRQNFANDPLNLLAVDGSANESKGDGDAATWLPPNHAFRCRYIARQTAVKAKYGLWMTAAEMSATTQILMGCPDQTLPVEPGRLHPVTTYSIAAAPLPTTPPSPQQKPATPLTGACEPGYSPCLPVVADLDCGDIDESLKPIHVTGDDPYRLDRDGDGWGCEP